MSRGTHIAYPVLLAAIQGDALAIESILNHYRGLICVLAKRTAYRPDGSVYQYVDDDIRHEMETALIYEILDFEIR